MGVGLAGPGVLKTRATVPEAGRYLLWLRGDVGRRLTVSVNGEEVGSVSDESGNDGNYATPIEVQLPAGRSTIEIERGGGSLRPADNTPSVLRAIVLQPADDDRTVQTVNPSQWRSLCNQPLDWIELVKSS